MIDEFYQKVNISLKKTQKLLRCMDQKRWNIGITLISHFVELLLLSVAKTTSGYQINKRGEKIQQNTQP